MFPFQVSVQACIDKEDLDPSVWRQGREENQYISLVAEKSFIHCKVFSYPQSFFSLDPQKLRIEYNFGGREQFFLEISNGKFTFLTPHFGQLQLFRYETAKKFFLADSFAALVALVSPYEKLDLNPEGVSDFLHLRFFLSQRTIFQGVSKVSENIRGTFSKQEYTEKNDLSLEELVIPYALFSQQTLFRDFEKNLSAEIQRVKAQNNATQWGSCLSGGTDSTLITYFAQKNLPVRGVTTLVFPEERPRQMAVLQKVTNSLSLPLMQANSLEIPLYEDLQESLIADPYSDPYGNWSIVMSHLLLDQGIDIVFTGMGADDYFSISSHGAVLKNPTPKRALPFWQKKYQNTVLPQKEKTRVSLLSESLSDSLHFYNTPWRNSGVWPVSPFISAESISFSLYLSDEQKQHKKFLKQFAESQLGVFFPEWETKIPLTPVFMEMTYRMFENYTEESFDPRIWQLNILEKKEVLHFAQKVQKRKKLEKEEIQFFFVLFKLNRYLRYIDAD